MSKLTDEAKNAIRAYMWKVFTPLAALLAIVSGAGGYVVSGLSEIRATADATKRATVAADRALEAAATGGRSEPLVAHGR